jgi:peptidoglycan-associated lipoprotein
MGKWLTLAAASTVAFAGAAKAEDCTLGQRYLALAKDRIASYANDEALTFLRQSVAACPSYDVYEQLGELAAQSAQKEDKIEAVKAFVEAHARAPTDSARAHTLYNYAALLNREGDPQNAYPLIKQARALDPANADIATLAGTIDTEQQHPTQEHIVRALRFSLFQPLAAVTASVPGGGARGPDAGATTGVPRVATASGPQVNIPINFKSASIAVDPQTQPNLELLAHALADSSLEGKKFVFIGHSDPRGGDEYNVELSRQRAQAISGIISGIEPALKDRIQIEGHGAHELIDLGTDDNALRANRRLQVLVR